MSRFSVVIAGGGVAAFEALLRLDRLAGDQVAITLLAPGEHFFYRALSVNEPFSRGRPKHYPIAEMVREADARWVRESLASVDVTNRLAQTSGGESISFDALLVAVGATLKPALTRVRTFMDKDAESLRGVVQDIEDGYIKRPVFIGPPGPAWPLPLYELALMAAERGDASCSDLEVTLVTADAEPLPAFGGDVSSGVRALLEEAGVTLITSSEVDVRTRRELVVQPGGTVLHPDSTLAMPQMTGTIIHGLPEGEGGFLPIESDCSVRNTRNVFAAGDCTDFPLKHGGVGAQQADIAAASIAALAGVDVDRPAPELTVRGKLLTGARPKYLFARYAGGKVCDGKIADEPIDGHADQVAAAELGPYLQALPVQAA